MVAPLAGSRCVTIRILAPGRHALADRVAGIWAATPPAGWFHGSGRRCCCARGVWRVAGSRYSGADPLTDQAAKFSIRLLVASSGLGDEAPHIAAFLVEKQEQPPGFVCACQRRPRQEGGRAVRRSPGHAVVPELVLVCPARPHAVRERMAGLAPG